VESVEACGHCMKVLEHGGSEGDEFGGDGVDGHHYW
jgi:hypothetical protein